MNRTRLFSAALLLVTFLMPQASFAGNDTLTNARAQKALSAWNNGNGTINVEGVQEIPAQNMAKVDITLENHGYRAPKNDAITAYAMGPGGGRRTYSGRATAYFIYYTDGRWVLSRIEAPYGAYNDINIAAP